MQEWRNTVTLEVRQSVPGSWEEKLEISKAIRTYASERGMKVSDVTEEMVSRTEMGISGWAKMYDVTPGAAPRPGGDGTGAAKKRAKADGGHADGQLLRSYAWP